MGTPAPANRCNFAKGQEQREDPNESFDDQNLGQAEVANNQSLSLVWPRIDGDGLAGQRGYADIFVRGSLGRSTIMVRGHRGVVQAALATHKRSSNLLDRNSGKMEGHDDPG